MMVDSEVQHDADRREFSLTTKEGHKAFLRYEAPAADTWDMYHTEVPTDCRGRGLGAKLAEVAFQCALAGGKRVRPTCTYLRHYVAKYAAARHKAIVVASSTSPPPR